MKPQNRGRDDVEYPDISPGFEEFRRSIRNICGAFHPEHSAPGEFSGWAKRDQRGNFEALDVSCNIDKIERSNVDVRRDPSEFYFLIFQMDGRSVMIQNDSSVELWVGDGVLIDSTQPSCFHYSSVGSRQVSIHLPRHQLIGYVGFEPAGGSKLDGALPMTRMLFDFIGVPAGGNLRGNHTKFGDLLVFDLLGSLLAPEDTDFGGCSVHSERLFSRVRAQIARDYGNPELKISDLADKTGLSVRYIQKLFSSRNDSFSQYLKRYRLERAEIMLRRRALLPMKITISEIAMSCGFGALSHFSRSFNERTGFSPSMFVEEAKEAEPRAK